VSEEQALTLDLSSWDLAYNGSEVVRHDTLERFAKKFAPSGFRKSAFCCCYGMAEATLFVTAGEKSANPVVRTIDADALQRHQIVAADNKTGHPMTVVGCGQAFELKVLIVNPETQLQCASNQVGEIWVHGKSTAQGYWGDAQNTQVTFNARLADSGEGPFMRTGDLGFIQDGQLFVTGRLKDLIILRGRNYYPQDIETAVQASHPALRCDSGAAFSIDIDGTESLVVVHEVDRGHSRGLNPVDVVDVMRFAVMTQFGLPLHDVVLLKHGRLAKTSSGKTRRRACREAYLAGTLESLHDVSGDVSGKALRPAGDTASM
jgi:acyl-CoA synthetase (AMP-forming)/AMP-acid ligase II